MKNYNKLNIDLSVVISTHKGKNKLPNLIESILKSSVLPNEIIIVGTNKGDFLNLQQYKKIINLRLFISKIANQIEQRKIGFKYITSKYVMQSDDDLIFKTNTIELMYKKISKTKKNILCANIQNEDNLPADYRWVVNYKKFLLFRILIFVLNGFKNVRSGMVTLSGRQIPDINLDTNIKREWLNSCLCFDYNEMKNYKFFECKGKAYYEDVYTSHNFFLQGYKLEKIENAIVIHQQKEKFSIKEHFRSISNQYKIVRDYNKSYILFLLDIFTFTLIFIFMYK